jgi:site-specific DNA-methyltransferase (cytosine-N4-specific)
MDEFGEGTTTPHYSAGSPPKLHYQDESVTLWHGDSLAVLREYSSATVNCCVTSPPYFGLRDYGVDGQMGAESSPAEYVEGMRALFAEVRRVLADDGTLWLNLGDSYSGGGVSGPTSSSSTLRGNGHIGGGPKQKAGAGRPSFRRVDASVSGPSRVPSGGLPAKNLLGIPWRVAFALQDDGWILRNDIIWAKPNGMPNSVTDRLATKHEHLFLLTKSPRYWFDLDPIRQPHAESSIARFATPIKFQHPSADNNGQRGQLDGGHLPDHGTNPGDVWSIPTQPFIDAHFAVMPRTLAERAIQAGCKPGGTVLDPFSGSGTTGLAAARHGRKYVGIDLNAEYLDLSLNTRLAQPGLNFEEEPA